MTPTVFLTQHPLTEASAVNGLEQLKMVVVKVTNRCNLKCAYCYEDISNNLDMRMDTFERLVDVCVERISGDRISFLFHGGEPSLLGFEWYTAAMAYAERRAGERGKRVEFAMQTNMVTISDDLLDVLAAKHVAMSMSIDGAPAVNRLSRGGGHRLGRNLLRSKERGLHVGLLCTLNQANWDTMGSFLTWLEGEIDAHSFKLNVSYPVGVGQQMKPLAGDQIEAAFGVILDHMYATRGSGIVEDNLATAVMRFSDSAQPRPQSLCQDHVCGAGSRVVGVSPNGDLLPCGRFEWNDRNWLLGNVHDIAAGRAEFRPDAVHRMWKVATENWAECSTCRARSICGYSCQAFIVRSNEKRNLECEPTRWVFDYLAARAEETTSLAAVLSDRERVRSDEALGNEDYRDYRDYNDYRDYRDYRDRR